MNNRALVGLFVVLITIFAVLYLLRDRVNLSGLGSFDFIKDSTTDVKNQAEQGQTEITATPSASITSTQTDTQQISVAGQQKGGVLDQTPATGMSLDEVELSACTTAIYEQNCALAEQSPVCGYEKIVDNSSVEGSRKLDYISACHYCRLYSPDGMLSMGDQTIYPLGFESGACNN
jgi:hypothetical protein